jgi:1,4-alpha-glucan branching enzyme
MSIENIKVNARTLPPPYETTVRSHLLPRGAEILPEGQVRFRFWAPAADRVRLEIDSADQVLVLEPQAEGWHELTTSQARVGSRYMFVLPDGTRVPDPASRFQPADVHGSSEVIDPKAHRWTAIGKVVHGKKQFYMNCTLAHLPRMARSLLPFKDWIT